MIRHAFKSRFCVVIVFFFLVFVFFLSTHKIDYVVMLFGYFLTVTPVENIWKFFFIFSWKVLGTVEESSDETLEKTWYMHCFIKIVLNSPLKIVWKFF